LKSNQNESVVHLRKVKAISLLLLLLGIIILLFSFVRSYPITIKSMDDTVFDKVDYLFWFGFVVVLMGLFATSISTERLEIRYICSILLIFVFYIHYMLFPLLLGADSHFFRGATKLFMNVGVTNEKYYFEWPIFFILNSVLANVLSLSVDSVCIVIFIVEGFLISSTLFILFSRIDKRLGFFGVALYVIATYRFLNYQFAPQSLALGFLLLALCLLERGNKGSRIALIILLFSMIYAHAFMIIFFLLSIFIMSLKQKNYRNLFLLSLAIYSAVLTLFTTNFFYTLPNYLTAASFITPGRVLRATFTEPVSPLDNVAQIISRAITLSTWFVLSMGFLFQLKNRDIKLRELVLAIVGFVYFGVGNFVGILGERAIQVLFLPLVAGYKPFLKKVPKIASLLVLSFLILFPFIILHDMYSVGSFQTLSGERTTNFLAENLDQGKINIRILGARSDAGYLNGLLPDNLSFSIEGVLSWGLTTSQLDEFHTKIINSDRNYDLILYNIILEKELMQSGFNEAEVTIYREKCLLRFNNIYNDGYSFILNNVQEFAYG